MAVEINSLKKLDGEIEALDTIIKANEDKLEQGRVKVVDMVNTRGLKLPTDSSFEKVNEEIIKQVPITWTPQAKPKAPLVSDITSNSVKVTADAGCKIRFSGNDYVSPRVFTDLASDTTFTFYSVKPRVEEDFLQEAVSNGTVAKTLVDIPGPTGLIKGTKEAGYYGPVNGIITAQEIFTKTGIADGTAIVTGDITWLKFSYKDNRTSKYKTLFVADRNIRHTISWDHINNKGYAYGKEITINSKQYKLRLIQATNEDPFNDPNEWGNKHNKAETNLSEWDKLIEGLVPDNSVSNWSGIYSWGQETRKSSNAYRVIRSNGSVTDFGTNYSGGAGSDIGWRPVLEVI